MRLRVSGKRRFQLKMLSSWVCEHDHEFIAERVGLDLDTVRENNEVDYIIMME